jgi:hypothetical protein
VEQGAHALEAKRSVIRCLMKGNPTSPVINYIGRPQSDDGESE